MNFKLPLIAVFAAILGLSACGGSSDTPSAESPAALVTTDTVAGTGLEATAGKTVTVHYTGWLYATSAPNFKGSQFDSSAGKTPFEFKLGANGAIAGFDQGVTGMKVGGKRTILIPSNLGYGTSGYGSIPGGAGLVFDVELVGVK